MALAAAPGATLPDAVLPGVFFAPDGVVLLPGVPPCEGEGGGPIRPGAGWPEVGSSATGAGVMLEPPGALGLLLPTWKPEGGSDPIKMKL